MIGVVQGAGLLAVYCWLAGGVVRVLWWSAAAWRRRPE